MALRTRNEVGQTFIKRRWKLGSVVRDGVRELRVEAEFVNSDN